MKRVLSIVISFLSDVAVAISRIPLLFFLYAPLLILSDIPDTWFGREPILMRLLLSFAKLLGALVLTLLGGVFAAVLGRVLVLYELPLLINYSIAAMLFLIASWICWTTSDFRNTRAFRVKSAYVILIFTGAIVALTLWH